MSCKWLSIERLLFVVFLNKTCFCQWGYVAHVLILEHYSVELGIYDVQRLICSLIYLSSLSLINTETKYITSYDLHFNESQENVCLCGSLSFE